MDHLESLQSSSRKRMKGHPTKLSAQQENAALQDPEYLELWSCADALRKAQGPASSEYRQAYSQVIAKKKKIIGQALTQFQEEWCAQQYQYIVNTCGIQDPAPTVDYEFQKLLRLDRERARLIPYIGISAVHEENEKLSIIDGLLLLAHRKELTCYLPDEEPTSSGQCPVADCRKLVTKFV